MRICGELEGSFNLKLNEAFLIYSDGQRAVATHHEVTTDENTSVPTIMAGKPASYVAFQQVAKLMQQGPAPDGEDYEIMGQHILVAEPDFLMWYRPSARRPVFFETNTPELNKLSGKSVLHPALLFMVNGLYLYVFAMASDARPTAETLLYRAPYFNLYENGHLCEGNFKMPNHYSPIGIPQWEKGFFDTSFAHSHITKALTLHPGGHLGLWRDMAVARGPKAYKAFPASSLVPLHDPVPETVTLATNKRRKAAPVNKPPQHTVGSYLKR